jgi:hypothetical protein
MEHSKLPWKKRIDHETNAFSGGISASDGNIVAHVYVTESDIAGMPTNKGKTIADENADFIVTACNEHETLKAKAELLQKAITCLSLAHHHLFINHLFINRGTPEVKTVLGEIQNLLSKAKKL